VIIAGFSEGGRIAPDLYFHLESFNISGIITMSAGGLPKYENHQILYSKAISGEAPFNSENIDKNYDMFHHSWTINEFSLAYLFNRPHDSPKIVGENGTITYRWLNSILFRKTIEFYREINIPVLFLHGELDTNVSVESTRYVEETLPWKPFTYVYYPEMWHYDRFYGEFMAIRRDISAWLDKEGL
jgi:pimeloyl-ACP methyl ester carboxylesterase